jgi:surface polysaccharide O-acyltransferase-like enzyme
MVQPLSNRNTAVDVVRIIATVMIVLAHVVAPVYERPDFVGGTAWLISLVTITVSRLGVPLLFLISGYLLTKKERPMPENFKHTWKRILFPCLFWSLVTYLILYVSQGQFPILNRDVFFTSAWTGYYFLIGLSIIYILNPIIQVLTRSIPRQYLELLLGVLAVSTIGQAVVGFTYQSQFTNIFNYWFLSLFYFIYGQYYRLYEDRLRHWRLLIPLAVFLAIQIINLGIIYRVRTTGFTGDLLVESYFGPTVMLSGLALFHTLMRIRSQKIGENLRNLLIKFANACFGVFLIHGILLDLILHKTPITPYAVVKINLVLFLGAATLIIIGGSFLISFLLGKMKYGRITLGQN